MMVAMMIMMMVIFLTILQMINAVSTHSTSTETCLQDKKWATFDTYSLSQNSYGLVMMMMIGWRSGDAVMSDVFWMVMPMMFLLRHYLPPFDSSPNGYG